MGRGRCSDDANAPSSRLQGTRHGGDEDRQKGPHHRSRIKEQPSPAKPWPRKGSLSTRCYVLALVTLSFLAGASSSQSPATPGTPGTPPFLPPSSSAPSSSASSSSASAFKNPLLDLSRTRQDNHSRRSSHSNHRNSIARPSSTHAVSQDEVYQVLDNNRTESSREGSRSERESEEVERSLTLTKTANTLSTLDTLNTLNAKRSNQRGSSESGELNGTKTFPLPWLNSISTSTIPHNTNNNIFLTRQTNTNPNNASSVQLSRRKSARLTEISLLSAVPSPSGVTAASHSSSSLALSHPSASAFASFSSFSSSTGDSGDESDVVGVENEIHIGIGPGIHFAEKPTLAGAVKSRDQIRRDLSRLSANLRTNSAATVVTDADNANANKCDRLYLSDGGLEGIRNGTFESPALVAEEGHSLQCIYTFVARPTERVEISFTYFNVRGTPPECVHEWVDLYTEVEDTDVSDLISTPFGGRYCGKIPPRRRISLYGGIAIGFYSDKNTTDETIFRGTYAFIDEGRFVVGTPVPRTICSYTVMSNVKRQGDLVSPTYPGVYPKDLSCTYKFIGKAGQRIRLEFRDFDLFYGGAHCPFDDVKIYDGMDPSSSLIGTYCGQQRNLVVYSSEHLMLVTFTTLERNTEAQNRGFSAVWEFSESFVKLDFITKNTGEHIRGTECDQRILSKGQSAGAVYSPNYPFPYLPKIVCRYFIYGLQDPQHLERVRLDFEKFDVLTSASVRNSEEDLNQQSTVAKCGDGFLKIYIKGQEVIQAYDKADFEFCGKEVPHDVVSDGPRLVLVFSSGETQGSGFKARYVFETEYRVPGTAAPDGSCRFSYFSSSRKKGEFNSPRFPSNYPSQINCTYTFTAEIGEQIRLVFDHFKVKMSDKVNYTGGTYGDMCQEDWIEIFNTWKDREDRLIGRYCGLTAPGPIESREGAQALKLVLHTDEEGVFSGFKARYIFFTAKSIYGECGRNVTEDKSGVLTTPNWPAPYDGPVKGEGSSTCNWYLTVRPGSRVMLHFQVFNIEGSPKDRGCPAAAVRIWEDVDGIPIELCGEKLLVDQSQYVSTRNIMRVTFITADKAVGAGGFQAVWTEVQDGGGGASCHHSYFRCSRSQFCIPNELKCNEQHNCGNFNSQEMDSSDEDHCGIEGDVNLVLVIVLGAAGFLSVLSMLCVYAQRKRRKRRRRLQLRRPPIHVCDNAGARFAAMDSV